MITTELPLPFAIYDKREKQNRFKRNTAGQILSGLLCPNDRILPFQFRVTGTTPVVSGWTLRNLSGGSDVDLVSKISLIQIQAHLGGSAIYYNGDALALTIPCGIYESVITITGGAQFYSELLEVTSYTEAQMPYMKLIWGNANPIGRIYYAAGSGEPLLTEGGEELLTEGGETMLTEGGIGLSDFQNIIYLNEFLDESDPEIYEEVIKDGEGIEVPVLQRITNRVKTVSVVPDFLKNALVAMQIHKNIRVISAGGVHDLLVRRARVVSNVDGSGAFSSVDMSFELDNTVVSESCGG